MATAATFGKRNTSKSVQPVRRQPRQGRASRIGAAPTSDQTPAKPAPPQRASSSPETSRPATNRSSINKVAGAVDTTILRIERTWFDGACGAFFVFWGHWLWRAADETTNIGILISGAMIIGGGLTLANHLLGRAKLIVDDDGFRGDGLVLAKKMKWEEINSFHIQTVNGFTTINAKAVKQPGSKSNSYVHVPNAAFKMKSMQFVEELISRRPDMASPTYEVMQRLGAGKLLRNL